VGEVLAEPERRQAVPDDASAARRGVDRSAQFRNIVDYGRRLTPAVIGSTGRGVRRQVSDPQGFLVSVVKGGP
jgi:hypothetical protein